MGSGNGKSVSDAELLEATMRIAAGNARAQARAENADRAKPGRPSRRQLAIHVILYVATVISTYLTGGLMFSITLMTILTVHEAGHYLFAMRHRVPASLPYFVPFPYSAFGTMGAVIAMPSQIPHRRALLDIGAAGPIAGFLVALPALMFGVHLSHPSAAPVVPGEWVFGDNLLVKLVSALVGPANPGNEVLVLHPIGFGGYVGCLVTAFNLIPVGQLDGGHVLHAWVGRRRVQRLSAWARRLDDLAARPSKSAEPRPTVWRTLLLAARRAILAAAARLLAFAGSGVPRAIGTAVVAVLVVLGALTPWKGWLLWAVLLTLLGVDHPRTDDEVEPLDLGRAMIALSCLAILVLTFVPVPVQQLP